MPMKGLMVMKKKFPVKLIFYIAVVFFSFLYNATLGKVVLGVFILYMLFSNRNIFYEISATKAYKNNQLEKALSLFEKAAKTTQNPRPKITYGYLLLKTGDIEKSSQVFKKMIDSDIDIDSKMKAKSNYALVLWKSGDIDGAINLLEEVLSEYTSTVVYGSLGYLYILKGDLEKAVEFNEKAYNYNDSDPIILDNLGNAYYLAGNLSKSEEMYKELMKLNPQFPEAYYNYSLLLKKLGRFNEALENMKKADNFNLSFLSNLTKSDIEKHIKEIEDIIAREQ